MTSDATPAPTGAPTMTRGRGLRVLVAAAVVVGVAWFAATPALAGLGEPVDPRDTDPEEQPTTTEAEDPTTTEAESPATTEDDKTSTTTTVADDGANGTDEPETEEATVDEDDGTSIAALGAVGLVGFIVGLLVAAVPLLAALSRRKAAPGPPPAPAHPAPPTPAAGSPAIGPAPSRDADQVRQQRVVLVEALIALRDKLPSAALGDEAAQALAAVGIHEVRPEGVPFDPAHHRAVHQVPTDDPARHNTVATVERPGYSDGTSTIRQPEVVVAVHGGSS